MRRLSICVIVLLFVLLATQAMAADPKKGVLRVSGDNSWTVYINGEEAGGGADWQQVGAYEFDLKNGSAVIAVHVHDAEPGAAGVGGFLGDIVLDNGDYFGTGIEDSEWKASADDSFMNDKDWIEPGFDDSAWEAPVVYDQFGAGVWGFGAGTMRQVLVDPDCTAFWVWAGPNDVADEVFFRYTIGALAVDSQGKDAVTWGDLKANY